MLTVKELLLTQNSTTTSITHTILFLTTQHNKIRSEGSTEKIKSYKTDIQQILVPLLIKFVHTSQSPFLWGFPLSIQFLTSTPLPPSQFAIKLSVLSPQRISLFSLSLPLNLSFSFRHIHRRSMHAPCGCSSQATSVHTCRLVVILWTTLVEGDSFKPACERVGKAHKLSSPFFLVNFVHAFGASLLTYLLCSFNKFSPLLTQRPLSLPHSHTLALSLMY